MKKLLCLAMAVAMCFSSIACVQAEIKVIPVYLNGNPIDFSSETVKPQVFMERTYVPLRKICETLGITMDWNATTKWLTFTRGTTKVEHQVPSNVVFVNGVENKFDTSSNNVNGSTLMPIRMLAEAIGANVSWGASTKSVYITLVNSEGVTQTTTSEIITEPTVAPLNDSTFDQKIGIISDLYNTVHNNIKTYKTSGVSAKAVVYKDSKGIIKKISLDPAGDDMDWEFTDCYQEYYFNEKGELNFVYTCSKDGKLTENRFYFYEGKLLKWVDQSKKIYTYTNGGTDTYGVLNHAMWVYTTYKDK